MEKQERIKRMVENERRVNRVALPLTFAILAIALYYIFTQEITTAAFVLLIVATQLPSLYRAWHRMKLLLTFNEEDGYRQFVRLEFFLVLVNILILGSFVALAWSIEGSLFFFIALIFGTFIPFLFLSVWVNRKLEQLDPNHVMNRELREVHRQAANDRLK